MLDRHMVFDDWQSGWSRSNAITLAEVETNGSTCGAIRMLADVWSTGRL